MYSVFASKRVVNNKGFIGYECGEKFVATKQQAIENANKKFKNLRTTKKFSLTQFGLLNIKTM